ncbi:carboxylate--amine ligase [Sunxiuqinia indica]|uniref:carboxylate--amine ligase n=1 Tax=Sunxiuqinia indica TaxID=2692584 RepID=UPI001358B2D0|nr:ATP-grasp domain-containing protein [Sunxiuqinia indica]
MKQSVTNGSFSVLIPDGECSYATSVVRCLADEKNIQTFVFSNHKNAPIRFSRYTSQFIHYLSGESKEEKLTAIIDAIKKTDADVLLPVDVETIRLIAEYKEKLTPLIAIAPVPKVHSFDIANDKWLLSLWLQENNIPHPNTILCNSTISLDDTISSLIFPILIKPRKGSGGKGIEIFENAEELQNWYNKSNHSEDFIIQSYIKGYDIDCSVLCLEGEILAHTIQKSLKYETDSVTWPFGIEFLDNDEIFNIVKKVVRNFKWSGVVHIDLRYDEVEQKAKLIEMNPRFWASVSASLFAGVNFPYVSCLSGLKRELPVIKTQNKRVVRTGPAIKMILKRLFIKRNDLFFDNTFLEFIIKDPLPSLFTKFYNTYNKYKKRLKI